jgi:hypothetical protein
MVRHPLRLRWLTRLEGAGQESTRRFLIPFVVRSLSTHFRDFLGDSKGWRRRGKPLIFAGGAAPCFVGDYVGFYTLMLGRLWDNVTKSTSNS